MKALVLEQYMHLAYRDVPEPPVGPDEVLIRVRASGICGSDIHGIDGSTGRRIPPVIMGHEAAGDIARVGASVTGWQIGDRVAFDSTIYCGKCRFCRRGAINLCDNRRVIGVSCAEYRRDGAFAEYLAVPAHILYRLPDGLSYERAALVEPIAIALHAVNVARASGMALDASAVVVGAGMIGLLVIQALRAAGCGTILAVDVDQGRLDLAVSLGADSGLRSDLPDIGARILEGTGGGADVTFDVAGIAPTFKMAVEGAHKGGSVVMVGNLAPRVDLPLQAAVTRELKLLGTAASCGEYPAALDLMHRGAFNLDAMISATAPLSEGAGWFERLHKGGSGLLKVVLIP